MKVTGLDLVRLGRGLMATGLGGGAGAAGTGGEGGRRVWGRQGHRFEGVGEVRRGPSDRFGRGWKEQGALEVQGEGDGIETGFFRG